MISSFLRVDGTPKLAVDQVHYKVRESRMILFLDRVPVWKSGFVFGP